MCFGGTPKQPDPIPPPSPAPVPTPEQSSPQAANDAKQASLQRLRFGLASTIKTSPQGLTGKGPDLTSIYGGGNKTTGGS